MRDTNSSVRSLACADMGWLGIALDADANAAQETLLSPAEAKVAVYRIETDEERMIARQARRLVDA